MVVDLREFDDFPVTVMLEAAPGEITSIAPEVTQVERVTFQLSIQKSGEEYFCQGTAKATVTMDCSRCAASFKTDLDESTNFIIRSDTEPTGGPANVVDNEDYVFLHGHDAIADVTEMVRQTLVLAIDLKPLCREDCKGLCPVCGTNLNERTCHCERNNSDGRWDGLKGLLQS